LNLQPGDPHDERPDIALDVYGTIVDTSGVKKHLEPLIGGSAEAFVDLWRQKQLEYSFRRALMSRYEPFSTCTLQALFYCSQAFNLQLMPEAQHELLEEYTRLPAYPDAKAGLEELKVKCRRLVAFSNGEEVVVTKLLATHGLRGLLDVVISVDDIRSFKPDPAVYRHLATRLEREPHEIWMASSNPFDVIGAKHFGLRAAWIKRQTSAVFDPWGIEPDLIADDLPDLAQQIDRFVSGMGA
jgi:2-haloacid dehalogenase